MIIDLYINKRTLTYTFHAFRRAVFWVNKKLLHGFNNGFLDDEKDLPEDCMADEFQENFMVNLANVFSDLINGIFDSKTFDEHMLIFLSSISNEVINTCKVTKIFTEILDFAKKHFRDGILDGIIFAANQYFSNALKNSTQWLIWHGVTFLSTILFQFYWLGFSVGKDLRIFFYGKA